MVKTKKSKKNVKAKSKDYMNLALLIFVILFMSFSYYFFYFEGDSKLNVVDGISSTIVDKIPSKDVDVCSGLVGVEKDRCEVKSASCLSDDCLYKKAMMYGLEESCYDIDERLKVATCVVVLNRNEIIQKAVISDDIGICDKFGDDELNKNYCYDNYYFAKRFNEKDLSYCAQISDSVIKEDCQNEI